MKNIITEDRKSLTGSITTLQNQIESPILSLQPNRIPLICKQLLVKLIVFQELMHYVIFCRSLAEKESKLTSAGYAQRS